MPIPDAVLPRDVVPAGRTAAVVVGAGTSVTFAYEVIGFAVGRPGSSPGTIALTACAALALAPPSPCGSGGPRRAFPCGCSP